MKTEDAIKKRCSIRKYTLQIPEDADIQKILNAAIWAPSSLNNQPWEFKVLKDKEKDKLSDFTRDCNIIKAVPVLICVFLDKEASYNLEKNIMAAISLGYPNEKSKSRKKPLRSFLLN